MINNTENTMDVGVVGLGVLGSVIAKSLEKSSYKVAVCNRSSRRLDAFMKENGDGKNFLGVSSPVELVSNLVEPRKIIIAVTAGDAVDQVINSVLPYLSRGDVLIDVGNSYFKDTIKRSAFLSGRGIGFIGAGVSRAEQGKKGMSIMAGGSRKAYAVAKDVLTSLAARFDGHPCCCLAGSDGCGHFLKMLHNAIEYMDLQLISETCQMMKVLQNMTPDEMSSVFASWNKDVLSSYLIESVSDVLKRKDAVTNEWLIDVIVDRAAQKGTGKWIAEQAFALDVPAFSIAESVNARAASLDADLRKKAGKLLAGPLKTASADRPKFLTELKDALYAAKVCVYAQGFHLLNSAAKYYGWDVDFASIAKVWRAGCVIRTGFLDQISEAYESDEELDNLLFAPFFKEEVTRRQTQWRSVTSQAIRNGIAVPAFSGTIAYYDSIRTAKSPANVIQALRDFFGGHSFERTDRAGNFTADWQGSSIKTTTKKI